MAEVIFSEFKVSLNRVPQTGKRTVTIDATIGNRGDFSVEDIVQIGKAILASLTLDQEDHVRANFDAATNKLTGSARESG